MAVLIGDTLAETASCLYLGCGYMLDKRRLRTPTVNRQQTKGVVRKLLAIALPITAGRYLNSILRTIENILVPELSDPLQFLQGTVPVGIRYAQGHGYAPAVFSLLLFDLHVHPADSGDIRSQRPASAGAGRAHHQSDAAHHPDRFHSHQRHFHPVRQGLGAADLQQRGGGLPAAGAGAADAGDVPGKRGGRHSSRASTSRSAP